MFYRLGIEQKRAFRGNLHRPCIYRGCIYRGLTVRTVRLGMPPDALRDLTFLDNYINDELIRRLDVANTNYAKLSKQINAVKKLHKSSHKPTRKTFKTKKKKSKNKSKKKKKFKSGQVYIARVDKQSELDSSNNDTSLLES